MDHTHWIPAFDTGIAQIDAEHRRLFAMVSEMQERLDDADLSRCKALATILMDRTEAHFVMEEDILHANGYPRLESHKRYHRLLCEKGRTLAGEVNACDTLDRMSGLCDAFLRFIIDDIIKGDMDFKSHVQESSHTC